QGFLTTHVVKTYPYQYTVVVYGVGAPAGKAVRSQGKTVPATHQAALGHCAPAQGRTHVGACPRASVCDSVGGTPGDQFDTGHHAAEGPGPSHLLGAGQDEPVAGGSGQGPFEYGLHQARGGLPPGRFLTGPGTPRHTTQWQTTGVWGRQCHCRSPRDV